MIFSFFHVRNTYILTISFFIIFPSHLLLGVANMHARNIVTTVFAVRHAEYDIIFGNQDPSLNAEGITRRNQLTKLFCKKNIDAIYTSNFLRTQETAQGVADSKALNIITNLSVPEQINQITTNHIGDCVLVVGHSKTIPNLISGLVPGNSINIQADEFHNLYIITLLSSNNARMMNLWYGDSPECNK